MKEEKTVRGFDITSFKDSYGIECSLQKSSNIIPHIWLGTNDTKLVVFEDERMGKYIETKLPENFMVNTRMHLTREQVAKLLPYLVRFVETGEIT